MNGVREVRNYKTYDGFPSKSLLTIEILKGLFRTQRNFAKNMMH